MRTVKQTKVKGGPPAPDGGRLVNQERRRLLAEYGRTHKTPGRLKVSFRGKPNELDVIRVPVSELRFNVQLGRLILDRFTTIHLDGGGDPEDPDVQREIEEKILALRETEELLKELKRDGQLEPGIVTEDGYVINGNRRLASLRLLERETGDQRFHYMEVAVLPPATREDLYLIEANLQMSPDTRARYGPVTTAVQVRWGLVDLQLPKKTVAAAMRLSEQELQERLDILDLIDGYLAYLKQPLKYSLVESTAEDRSAGQGKWHIFVEVNSLQNTYRNDPRWEQFLKHLYLLVSNGASMDDIRKLKKMKKLGGLNLYAVELEKLVSAEPEVEEPAKEQAKDPVLGELLGALDRIQSGSEDSERLRRLRGPDPNDLDKWKQLAQSAYQETLDTVGNLEEKEAPIKLLSQALKKLESVDFAAARKAVNARGKKRFKKSEAQTLLNAIGRRQGKLLKDIGALDN